jgi:anti-sigma B factor antagonist
MTANPAETLSLAIIGATADEEVVQCHGRIVAETTPSLRSAVKPLLTRGKTVILDLTDVTYMDSSGLGAVASLYVSAKAAHCRLRVINLNARLKELFRITRLGDVFAEGRDSHEPELP